MQALNHQMKAPSSLGRRPLWMACLGVALSLSMYGESLPVYAAALPAASEETAPAPRKILVAGVPAGSPVVQRLIDQAYQKALADAGDSGRLDTAAWQQVVAAINAVLHKAGYPGAQAYLSDQIAAFEVHPAVTLAPTPTRAAGALSDGRHKAANGSAQRVAVRGFVVDGVGKHPQDGVTPASIQKLADAQFAKLGGTDAKPVELDFDQLQDVADAITKHYREAGFIVANAFLPEQTIGKDGLVHIHVLEGHIGRIEVQGTKRYRPWVIAASAAKLRGKVLRKRDVETALLYDRDLPGLSVSSTFQPGEKTGQTDLIMVAREQSPLSFNAGVSNYGTPVTGRYRATAGLDWRSPLGIGDEFTANVNYAFDPHQNTYGSLGYSVPVVKVPGLRFMAEASRSELELNSGQFSALDVRGPTSRYAGGAEWKFFNTRDLSMTGSLRYIHERSALTSLGMPLSDQRFDVAQLGFALEHTDRRYRGMDMLSVAVRKSLDDDSRSPDLVSPHHDSQFVLAKLGYTRIQFLTPTQRLFFKFAGQYSGDALTPMEKFVIGGPDSVRAYPIAEALSDRGFYTALEYHVDAPGFADTPSPFHGAPWHELLTLEGFVDYARGYPSGADRRFGGKAVTYSGAGVGLIFRLPRWHHLLFHLDYAVPLGSRKASDKHDHHIYGRFNLTF